jgi:hypothetical protein
MTIHEDYAAIFMDHSAGSMTIARNLALGDSQAVSGENQFRRNIENCGFKENK